MTSIALVFFSLHLLIVLFLTIIILCWKSEKSSIQPKISIIISAHNEERNLKKLIPALIGQHYPHFQIIVAMDRCADGSKAYLSLFKSHVIALQVDQVPDDWDHKKYALTKAIEKADGEWMVLTDADCLPNTDYWLASIAKEITSERAILIGVSPYMINNSFLSNYNQFEAFMTYLLYLGFGMLSKPYMGVGRNIAFRKAFWQDRKGYESIKSIRGGDDDLFVQKNATSTNCGFVLGKDSLVNTFPQKSWRNYWHQKLRHFSVSSSYHKSINCVLSSFHISHLLVWIFAPFLGQYLSIWSLFLFLFIKFTLYKVLARKIGAGFNYILLPLVDMLYATFTPLLGIWSQLKRDIKWKN